jgi:hypothetical protein
VSKNRAGKFSKPSQFGLHNSCTIAPEQWLFAQQ